MTVYRVRVEVHVLVEARNQKQAKAKAETAVKEAVGGLYVSEFDVADGWEGYSFRATKAERWESGAEDE